MDIVDFPFREDIVDLPEWVDIVPPGNAGRKLLQIPQFHQSSGLLNKNGWYTTYPNTAAPINSDGNAQSVGPRKLLYQNGRIVQNLNARNNPHDKTLPIYVTTVVGREYNVRIGAGSPPGSTAVCTGAFTGTLTGDGVMPKAFLSAKVATGTLLQVTPVGNPTDIQVEDVTDKAVKVPSEFVPAGVGYGPNLVDQEGAAYWGAYGSPPNTIVDDDDAVKITYVSHSQGGYLLLNPGAALSENFKPGFWYEMTCEARVSSGGNVGVELYGAAWIGGVSSGSTTYTPLKIQFVADQSTGFIRCVNMSAGESIWIRNIEIKEASDGYAVFDTHNANTVDGSGNLIEAVGAKLATVPTLYHPADAAGVILHRYAAELVDVAEGSLYIDVKLPIDTDAQNALADFAYAALDDVYGTGDLLIGNAAADGSLVRSHDGVTAVTKSYPNVAAGNIISFGLIWSLSEGLYQVGMRVGGTWEWSAPASFAGFTFTDLIALMPGATISAEIPAFSVWDR